MPLVMSRQGPRSKNEPIVIIGAGVFGLSTALELKTRGYSQVTILDRYLPPVPDGSSVDISRIIRVEYADPLYAKMARESHKGWLRGYKDHYHESGFVMLFDKAKGNEYVQKSREVSRALGQEITEYPNRDALACAYPGIQVNFEGLEALGNPHGGWADAAGAIRQLSAQCSGAGVSFLTGPRGRVTSLRYKDKRVVGVNVAEGSPIPASQVILSTGAWSNTLVNLSHTSSASGQPVGFIQLTDGEAKQLEKMPVIINLSTGIFCFPPTPGTKILKVARHGYGYATRMKAENTSDLVSSPKRDSNNAENAYLPEDADAALREGLRQLVPQFANHPWMTRRLCWYSDTPEGDFVIDHHPEIDGLFLATGGAGQ